jgi:ADP-ribose pyrophosphatase YjhB (NUDIX family)
MNVRVATVILRDNEILLMKHRRRGLFHWALPGGAVQEGETVPDCVRRELIEETGLEVQLGRLLYLADVISPDRRKHTVNLIFLAEVTGGEFGVTPRKTLGEHLDEPHWFSLDDMPTFYPPVAQRIRDDAARGFPDGAIYLGNVWVSELENER